MMGIHDGGRSVRVAVGLVQYQRDSDGDWWVAVGRRNGAIKWDALPASEHTRTLDELATLRAQLAGVREKVEKLERFDATLEHGEARMQRSDDACWIDRDDVLAALDGAA